MTVSPDAHKPTAHTSFVQGAGCGKLTLPVCRACGAVQYPVQDFCAACLSPCDPREVAGAGSVIAWTTLARSADPRFTDRLPLQIASIRLDAGPLLLAFLPQVPATARVAVRASLDDAGRAILTAEPTEDQPT